MKRPTILTPVIPIFALIALLLTFANLHAQEQPVKCPCFNMQMIYSICTNQNLVPEFRENYTSRILSCRDVSSLLDRWSFEINYPIERDVTCHIGFSPNSGLPRGTRPRLLSAPQLEACIDEQDLACQALGAKDCHMDR